MSSSFSEIPEADLFAVAKLAVTQSDAATFSAMYGKSEIRAKLANPDLRARLISHAIKYGNPRDPQILNLLLRGDLQLTEKSKDIAKVFIKFLANMPESYTQASLSLLLKNRAFFDMLISSETDGVKAMLKQINADVTDYGKGLRALSRIKAIKRIIASCTPEQRQQLMEAVRNYVKDLKPAKQEQQELAVALFATFCESEQPKPLSGEKSDVFKSVLKTMSTIERVEKNAESYYNKVIEALLAGDVTKVQAKVQALLRQTSSLAGLRDWQLNQILGATVVTRNDKVLDMLLQNERFQRAVAGDEYRNRVLCLAIESMNSNAVAMLCSIPQVAQRCAVKAKEPIKMFVQTFAFLPKDPTHPARRSLIDIAETLCRLPELQTALRDEAQKEGLQKMLVGEMLKSKDGDRMPGLVLLFQKLAKASGDQQSILDFVASLKSPDIAKMLKLDADEAASVAPLVDTLLAAIRAKPQPPM